MSYELDKIKHLEFELKEQIKRIEKLEIQVKQLSRKAKQYLPSIEETIYYTVKS